GAAHARNFGQRKNPSHNFLPRRGFDFINGDRSNEIEPPGFYAAQRLQMRATTEEFTDVMHVRANIKTLAAQDTEIDFRRRDSVDRVAINVDEARFALNHLSLAGQFVERHAAMFFGRNHRWHLIKIAAEFFKRGADFIFSEPGNRPLIDNFTLSILGAGRDAKHER